MKLRGLWWWIDRWRKSTAYTDMTLEEQGAYRNLLDDAALRGGPLPNDEHVLAKACGDPRRWRRVRSRVMTHFTLEADGWHNATLDEVLSESERRATKQAAYRQRRVPQSGNAAGNGTGNEHGNKINLMVIGDLIPEVSRSSSERDSQGETTADPPCDVWLRELQAAYPPSAVSSGHLTEVAFLQQVMRFGTPDVTFTAMLVNLDNQKRGHQWRVKGMIPRLDRWLSDGLWQQTHEADPPATRLSEKTIRTLSSAAAFVKAGRE